MCGGQLTVYVGHVHRVGIHDGEFAHTSTAQHLSSVGSYATYAYYQYVCIAYA
jgi:hypothetical protein